MTCFLLCRFVDIMVCTGCCGTLDFVVTHLFKMLSKRRKKNPTGMDAQPPCLSHPEMIQQVGLRWSLLIYLVLVNSSSRCMLFITILFFLLFSTCRCCRQYWTSSCLKTVKIRWSAVVAKTVVLREVLWIHLCYRVSWNPVTDLQNSQSDWLHWHLLLINNRLLQRELHCGRHQFYRYSFILLERSLGYTKTITRLALGFYRDYRLFFLWKL